MREGWISDNLSNCIKLKSGDGLTAKKMISGEYPVFGGNGIAGYHNDFNLSGENIVIGRVGALCGNSRCINKKIWLTDNAFKISEFKYEFDLEFLNYLLNNVELRRYARQAAQPVISNSSLKNVILSFPKSLSEQKEIVEILDETFEAIDQAKANIEKNIQNAKELFQSKLNDIFSQKGGGWEEKRFKDVCVLQRGFDLPKRLRKEGEFVLVTSSGIKESIFEYKVEGPGVVTGRSGSIGNVFYVDGNFWPLNTALYIKDFKSNNELYVYYFLKNFDLSKYSTGTGVPTLNRNFVHDEIVLTTERLEDQIAIVNTLEALNDKSKELERFYIAKLSNLDDLKKSILQKAISGELTNKRVEI